MMAALRHIQCRSFVRLKLETLAATQIAHKSGVTGNLQVETFRGIDDLPGPGLIKANFTHLRNGFQKLHETLVAWVPSYGPMYLDNLFGEKWVVISNPDNVEKVFRAEAKMPTRSFGIIQELIKTREKLRLPKSLVQVNGEEWAALRKILANQMLPPVKLKHYYEDFSLVAHDAVKMIPSYADAQGVVEDLKPLINKWSMESIGMFAFGQRTGLIDEIPAEKALSFFNAMDGLLPQVTKFSSVRWLKYIQRSEYKQFVSDMEKMYELGSEFVNNIIDEIKKADAEGIPVGKRVGKSLVYYLMSEERMTRRDCLVHALDAYAAGLDTTSASVTWLLYCLGTNPEKQEKLAAEIAAANITDNALSAAVFQKLPFLRACMKESARLFSTAPMLARILDKDLVLDNVLLPKNTNVLLLLYGMSRDDKMFPDADKFIPERWLRGAKNEVEINPFLSLPFGYGPRSCIGKRIAEAEMQVLIFQVLKHFRLECIGKPQLGEMIPLLTPTEPLKLAIHAR